MQKIKKMNKIINKQTYRLSNKAKINNCLYKNNK